MSTNGGHHYDDDELISRNAVDDLADFKLEGYKSRTPADDLFDEAEEHYFGRGDTIQDYAEAMRLYRQAAKLGSTDAYIRIGEMYEDGDTVREDLSQALEYYKEAVRRGSFFGYAFMGKIFSKTRHMENARKAWRKFFEALRSKPHAESEACNPGTLIYQYVREQATYVGVANGTVKFSDDDHKSYLDTMRRYKESIMRRCDFAHKFSQERGMEMTERELAIESWFQSNL